MSESRIRVSLRGTRGARMPMGGPLTALSADDPVVTALGGAGISTRVGFPVVLLTTRGAKTNQERTTPLGGFKAHSRVLSPGFALFHPGLPVEIVAKDPLAVAWRRFDHALDAFIDKQLIAA